MNQQGKLYKSEQFYTNTWLTEEFLPSELNFL